MKAKVVVIGSVNADFIMAVDARPAAGETMLASTMRRRPGGKAANQAAAAARAGASTIFIGAVGDDPSGAEQIAELVCANVDVSHVITMPRVSTGMAFILVTPDGENSIVVASGANAFLDEEVVIATLDRLAAPTVVVLQTETPPRLVDRVAAWCAERSLRVIINNGPYVQLAPETLAIADPLVVNQHEARQLCGEAPRSSADLAEATFARSRARSLLVTLGEAGAQLKTPEICRLIPPAHAEVVVDTTGAGDTFVGALAAALASDMSLDSAATRAAAAAAEAVTWHGARPPRTLGDKSRFADGETA